MKIKGSYFPNEVYDYESSSDKIVVFVEMLKQRGYYIGEDWHIRSYKGNMGSKLMRNGYYLTCATYNRKTYYFMEHRVIWVWINGAIPPKLVINHKDYNRANNNISNLEILTQSQNTRYSAINQKPPYGEKGKNATCTNKQAQAIKTMAEVCGFTTAQISALTNISKNTTRRIIKGERYPNIVSADNIMSVYPSIVQYTMDSKLSKIEQLKNACLGLSGEVGEFNDMIKKHVYHGHEINPIDLILELGDVLYYLTTIANIFGWDISELMLNNSAKVMNRYKDGFSIEASNNRIENQSRGVIVGDGDNR